LGLPEFLGLSHWFKGFLSTVFVAHPHAAEAHGLSHGTEIALMLGAFMGALLSIGYAYMKYVKGRSLPVEEGRHTGFAKVVYNKYYLDEIYNLLIVKPIMLMSDVFHDIIDKTFVDGAVNWSGKLSLILGAQVRKVQSGYIGFYLLAMVLSIVVMFLYAFIIQ
jgi:NADH-quinone oxidoreductase subunit L